MSIPVAFYVPNILCYARIVLAFVGLYCAIASLPATFTGDIDTNNNTGLYAAPSPGLCIWIWILSAFLDLFDGLAARRLMQCSKFGVFLDILADNILRTATWTATAIVAVLSTISDSQSQSGENWRSTTIVLVACGIVCLEWATMLCTQLKSAEDGRHWKAQNGSMASNNGAGQGGNRQQEEPPVLVSAIFRNNFRSPLGILSIYGLFSCGMWTYGSHIPQIRNVIPLFDWWWFMAVVGRLLSILVEIWLCSSYLWLVLSDDERKRGMKR